MKSRETLIRLKKFQVDEKRRRVAQIEGMIAEFDRIAGDLEREIAERGRYPAINILKSVSRTMPRAADPAYLPVITRARQVMATYADMEELIRLGAYRPGSSAEVDEAIRLHGPLEAFLSQKKDEASTLSEGYQRLQTILSGSETEN